MGVNLTTNRHYVTFYEHKTEGGISELLIRPPRGAVFLIIMVRDNEDK